MTLWETNSRLAASDNHSDVAHDGTIFAGINITLHDSVFTPDVKQNLSNDLFACQRLFCDISVFTSFILVLTGGWPLLFSSSLSKTISLSESVVGLLKRKKKKVLVLNRHYQETFSQKPWAYICWGKKEEKSKLLLNNFLYAFKKANASCLQSKLRQLSLLKKGTYSYQ